ncbi:MAG: PSD1 and planctomycete cytochrome C domain-containing protein [Opitutales bacterium]
MSTNWLIGNTNTFFESKVRPILSEKCYECHSASANKSKGGLRLDHINLILKGGDSGPALVIGKPLESLIMEAIRYEDPDFHMPPKEKLSKQVVVDFEKWIMEGAHWPKENEPVASTKKKRSSFNLEKRKNEHWCWQPIQKPEVPSLPGITLDPIDSFIRARLDEEGLLPSEKTDKRTWLRRVTYDLIGLPPSLEEIKSFLGDQSESSHEKVVDRLLSSSHFGEKWARHWMDLVRYAETCGHEFDYPLENPHEYRDYLIRAFNEDVPYDQLLKEHVAGDLIKTPRIHSIDKFNESIIGTGFWYFHEAVHAPTDSKVDNADRMENQLDVFGKTFLGLTIGCARCHDHKFDAISEKDYYSLATFMQGSTRQEYPLDPHGKRISAASHLIEFAQEGWKELENFSTGDKINDLPKPSKYWEIASLLLDSRDAQRKDSFPLDSMIESSALEHDLNKTILSNWCKHFKEVWNLKSLESNFKKERDQFIGLKKKEENYLIKNTTLFADFSSSSLPDNWKTSGNAFVPSGNQLLSLSDQEVFPINTILSSKSLGLKRVGSLRSQVFKIEKDRVFIRANANKGFIRIVLDNYHMGKHSGLLFGGTIIKSASSNGNFQWFSLSLEKYKGHWGYLEFVDKGDSFIEIDQIRVGNGGGVKSPKSHLQFLFEHAGAEAINLPNRLDEFLLSVFKKLNSGSIEESEKNLINWLHSLGLIDWGEFSSVLQETRKKAKAIDKVVQKERYVLAMGAGSDFEGHVYVRGSPHKLGESVRGRNLTALGGKQGTRLDLAMDLTSEQNPLVARVMVNRIWSYLFGRGIVPTPDDFGPMGQQPSHPELLDWLAHDFRSSGWSVKNMIRTIVLSQTYGQSSLPNPVNEKQKITSVDPQNILLHRMPIRRLQAEAIRDSILAFSGRLDSKMFGRSVGIHRTPFMTGRGGRGSGPLDGAGRRSIYGSVYRNFLSPFMLAFDQPSPFGTKGRRSVSNVPAQSLALMNDPFILDQCKLWAKGIMSKGKDNRERINQSYLMVTGKSPTEQVYEKLLNFIEVQSTAHGKIDERVWADLAHVLINSKSFLFLN